MTPHHELLARAIEALRILGDPNGDYSLADCDAAQEIIREFDNLPPAVAAEPAAYAPFCPDGMTRTPFTK